jgi:trimeric autotransporter adhesin
MTNVAAGINPTDAVNVGQLSSLTSGFQSQVTSLQSQIGDNRTEAQRGIAAAVATASAPMPSAPGKTTWQIRGSTFQSEYGIGVGFAYRLHTSMPFNVVGGYGNGGGREHTAYVGLGGEF